MNPEIAKVLARLLWVAGILLLAWIFLTFMPQYIVDTIMAMWDKMTSAKLH